LRGICQVEVQFWLTIPMPGIVLITAYGNGDRDFTGQNRCHDFPFEFCSLGGKEKGETGTGMTMERFHHPLLRWSIAFHAVTTPRACLLHTADSESPSSVFWPVFPSGQQVIGSPFLPGTVFSPWLVIGGRILWDPNAALLGLRTEGLEVLIPPREAPFLNACECAQGGR
jgi:hypothetical protein